jgi:hypothetical protein
MPVASGFDTHLRVGRWHYDEYSNVLDAAGKRGYIFSIESGSYMIPTGAVLAETGSRIKLSYSYIEEQTYKFSDREIKMYLCDAITTVNNCFYNFGHTFVYDGNSFVLSANITNQDLSPYLYAQYAAYNIKKQLESEGLNDRIYVRDINITIDTSKGLGDLQKSSSELYKNFKGMINMLNLKGQEAAFCRIDVYSTERYDNGESYDASYSKDEDFF